MSFRFFFTRMLPGIIIVGAILTFIVPGFTEQFGVTETWFIRIAALLIILGVIFWRILFYRCKICGKWFALRKGMSTFIGQDSYNAREETGQSINEFTGKVTARQYTDVEYSRDVHKVAYSCKYCGSRKYREEAGKYRKS